MQLPDFVLALEKYQTDQQKGTSRSPSLVPKSPPLKPYSPEPSSSRASPIPGKLRYAAYEAPRPTPKLRRKSSGSSRHSDDGSSHGGLGRSSYQDPMTMTITPGDLSIAAQTADLRSIPSVSLLRRQSNCASLRNCSRALRDSRGYHHFRWFKYWTKSPLPGLG